MAFGWLMYWAGVWGGRAGGPNRRRCHQPFVSAVCSFLFLDQAIKLAEILGGVLIIIGLIAVIASRVLEERALASPEQAPLLDPASSHGQLATSKVSINDDLGDLESKAA